MASYAARTTWVDLIVVSLAGPAANLAAALVAGVLLLALDAHWIITLNLGLLAVSGVLTAVFNLVPSGDDDEPDTWSDGRRVLTAYALRGEPAVDRADPNAATSVPPPQGVRGNA